MQKKTTIQFIFATMLLDAMGIGLLIPIFPDIIRRFSPDADHVSLYFGIFISIYAFMQFVASPVLGSLSDRYGRRPVLLVSLLGAGIDYLIMAFAPNMWILLIGRFISGLTGASMTVATAYMADISDDQNRSANFGMIGAAWGLGFIIGPSIGGLLGAQAWQYPFLVAAALNLLNFVFGYFILPESLPLEKRRQVDIKKLNPFISIIKILRPSPILIFIWAYLLLFLAGQAHPAIWTLFTQLKFNWTTFQVGLSISFVGLTIAIAQGGLTRIINPRLGEWRTLILGVVVSILAYLAFGLATEGWMMYLIMVPSSLSGLAGPALQSLISKQVPSEEQGELQGTLVGLSSLTAIIGPLLFTGLFGFFTNSEAPMHFPGAAYVAAALICAICLVLLVRAKKAV